jgi:hypothetical protein
MNVPNLASQPFLNARPVWLVTIAALFFALILAVINLQVYFESTQSLTEQLALNDQFSVRYEELSSTVLLDLKDLDKAQWSGLSKRVESLNVVLKGHEFSWLRMLDDIESVLPYQIKVVSISPTVSEDGAVIAMTAIAKNRGAMLELFQRMIDDPHFSEPLPTKEQWPESSKTVEYVFALKVDYIEGPS